MGKALAMEMVLNDRRLTAAEALHYGLVNRVVPTDSYLEAAIDLAAPNRRSRPPRRANGKRSDQHRLRNLPLQAGLAHERRLFYLLFSTEDQKEGMAAFVNKRQAEWQGNNEL
ncbi:MAG: enoyl-CoA hydratase-related protein [Chloroflexi bacterium]|nr:enoyl-CoA hydratase-related protein [Chloroflexota bacterium]